MKKPVRRVRLLEDLLSDLLDVVDILAKLELEDGVQLLAAKRAQLYQEIHDKLCELISDLTSDVAREHRAA